MRYAVLLLPLLACAQPKAHQYGDTLPSLANPVDTTAGDINNVSVVQNTPATAGVLIDAGTRYVVAANWTNEGTSTGWAQVFCGQTVPDAGGTNDAGTAPAIQVRCPAGTICGTGRLVAPVSCGVGAVWYSSSTAGLLTVDAGVPNMTLLQGAIR